jgi:hypothetical protein
MNVQIDLGAYSDSFKDAYGFRPHVYPETYEQYVTEMELLDKEVCLQIVAEKEMEQQSYNQWCESVQNIMSLSGISQQDAIRWLMDAEGLDYNSGYDQGYYRYLNGLGMHRAECFK